MFFKQAFSSFSACLGFSFVLQASIFQLFCLPRFQFCSSGKHFPVVSLAWASVLFFKQAFSKFFACLVFIFVLQASAFRVLCLPGSQFCSLGKRFPAFLLAWTQVLFCRQTLSSFSACLGFSFVLQAVNWVLGYCPVLEIKNSPKQQLFCHFGECFSSFQVWSSRTSDLCFHPQACGFSMDFRFPSQAYGLGPPSVLPPTLP